MQQQVDSNANILHLPLDLRQGAYGILFHGTNVLVCHTKSGDRIIRNFPGGGVEPGEDFETALKREFSEEAGVEPVSVAHFHSSNGLHINPDYPKNRIQFHYYLVEVTGDVNFEGNGDDVGRLEWIPLNELPLKDMLEPDREVAEILRDKTLNEAQTSTGVFPEKKEQDAGQYHNLPIEADKKLYSDFQEAVGRLRCLDLSEQTRIQTALLLMFKAHASQEPRPNGEAYINHPLRVALRSITEFGVITCDGICAALLHDSVEDQASTLIRIEGDNLTTISPDSWSSAALGVIGERFGASCARMVALLTNPDFDVYAEGAKEAGDTREVVDLKNEAYFRHFFEISEADEEAFKVKLADFSENALSIQNLEAGSKKDKLCKKYGPVLKEVIRLLSAPETAIHVSETFLNRAITIYDSCYKEALADRPSDPRDTQS